jgi:uncharacterized repeat protein (TIGR01451 family)
MQMQILNRFVLLAGLAAGLAGHAFGAYSQTVEVVSKAEREVTVLQNGVKVKKVAPVEKIVPGDEVTYTLTYTNKTGKPVNDIAITNPVPRHTRYRDGSAAGAGTVITFSVDGGKSFAAPEKLMVNVKDKSGTVIQRPAVAQDYTHIRWQLKQTLAPGQSGSVRFKAVIS